VSRAVQPVTGDTITDEQIRELMDSTDQARDEATADLRWWCQIALGERPGTVMHPPSAARARCAAAWNARYGAGS
jgi:hypothetical protein